MKPRFGLNLIKFQFPNLELFDRQIMPLATARIKAVVPLVLLDSLALQDRMESLERKVFLVPLVCLETIHLWN